jgi:ABC-2 type transport system permease protein
MKKLIFIELSKIFHKKRTYIAFTAIFLISSIIELALYFQGDKYIAFATRSLRNSFEFSGNLLNGYLIAFVILQSLSAYIPFLILLVGGDLLAGEATAGTYRIMLTRPITRESFVTAKFIAGAVYTNLLLFFMMIASLGISVLLFGTGELLVFKSKLYVFASNDVLWRFLLSYGFVALSMTTVLSLSILFSSLVENAIGPIISTMFVIITFLIISALKIESIESIKPFLFTNHMSAWREFFIKPLDYGKIIISFFVLLGHIFFFYLLTVIIFKRKDILS